MRHAFNDAFDADERKLIEAALTENFEVKSATKAAALRLRSDAGVANEASSQNLEDD